MTFWSRLYLSRTTVGNHSSAFHRKASTEDCLPSSLDSKVGNNGRHAPRLDKQGPLTIKALAILTSHSNSEGRKAPMQYNEPKPVVTIEDCAVN
jgi:hypothetical protein